MDKTKIKRICKIAIFGILVEVIILAILFTIFSFVILYSNISISIVGQITTILGGIGLFLTSFVTARIINKKGLLIGLIFGLTTSLAIFILTFLRTNILFSIDEITKTIIITISACLGGIFGVNSKD